MQTRIEAVSAIEKKHGTVTADLLVKAARNKDHPLHDDFDWDDESAAHAYRIEQARAIICSVRVVVTTSEQKIRTVAYVRDPRLPHRQQGYVSVATLRNDAEYAQEVIDAEVSRIRSLLERLYELAAAVDLQDELQTALNSVLRLHSSAKPRPKPPAPPSRPRKPRGDWRPEDRP